MSVKIADLLPSNRVLKTHSKSESMYTEKSKHFYTSMWSNIMKLSSNVKIKLVTS